MMFRALLLLSLAVACVTSAPDPDRETSELTGTTIVSLTFDDTFGEQYQVGAMLEARGMRGTFYVNSPRLGWSGYMTLSQALSLQQRGHEIAGHTLDHVDLTSVSLAEARHQVCDDRDALLADGFAVTSFAYPFGADNASVHDVVKGCNYSSARDVGGLVTPESCNGCPYANPIPPADAFMVRTNGSIRNTTSLDAMKLYVTQAEGHGGGWVPFIFHHICDNCDTYSVSATTLAAFLDWLAARSAQGTQVATVQAVIGGGAPPPPPPSDTEPPTARVAKPGDGAVVSGPTQVVADVTDNVGIARVRFFVDGTQIGERLATPYKVKWDAQKATRGPHQISVQAVDGAGNTTTSPSVTVTVM